MDEHTPGLAIMYYLYNKRGGILFWENNDRAEGNALNLP